ncbi:mannan endo-1,4-beta-mannosidase A and B [Kineococcus sp. R8]|uniref:glycosyl hydrolase n=1 Tax=Kineococcus siccus TaxID=2696567 RepID=UPI00141341FE|nr:glycosyl hydrolase [Kineococcus siccus]NAZ82959.1 mannan endo-1,4-beta-mannosidase A and B [Kineococcus siccus]
MTIRGPITPGQHPAPPARRLARRTVTTAMVAAAGALSVPQAAGAAPRSPHPGRPRRLTDRHATPQARRLFAYLDSLQGTGVLSGQQESTWNDGPEYEMDYIEENTGLLPAVRGFDYGDSPDFTPRAIAWWRAGGIVELSFHMGAPTKPNTYDGSRMSVDIDAVLTPGTAENRSFNERLDAVSEELLVLQGEGIPVIWRPFHEAGGDWFWWSMEGGDQYNRVWRYAYHRMVNEREVHNLVWLLGFNGEPDGAFYPGPDVVDMSGGDTYAADGDYDPQNDIYTAVRAIVGPDMPVALHENGPIPDPELLQSTSTDWVFLLTWHGEWLTDHNPVEWLQAVYASPYVVTRRDVPNFR